MLQEFGLVKIGITLILISFALNQCNKVTIMGHEHCIRA